MSNSRGIRPVSPGRAARDVRRPAWSTAIGRTLPIDAVESLRCAGHDVVNGMRIAAIFCVSTLRSMLPVQFFRSTKSDSRVSARVLRTV